MIQKLIDFALAQRFVVLILAAVLVGAGVVALKQLPIDAIPDVTNVQVQINTNAPTLAPVEVEQLITFPIEVAMSGLPDTVEVRSLSKFGLSQVTVVFKDHVDIYFARQLVFERLQQAKAQIPAGLGEPEMGPVSTGLGEIFQYVIEREPAVAAAGQPPDQPYPSDQSDQSVRSGRDPAGPGAPEADLRELRTIQDWMVKRQLRTVPGVADVNSFGGFEKQYEVLVDPEKLVGYGLTVREVFEALEKNNANAGGGYIEHASQQYLIRGIGLIEKPEDIENIIIAAHDGNPVRVREVAEVVEGNAIRQGAVTKDGKGEVVTGIILMLQGANSRTVVEAAKEKVAAVQKTLPKGVRLVPFYDRAEMVDRTIHTVEKNLFEGGILVVFVLLLLLGNLRAALIVACAIPLSMLFAAVGMVKYGISGNLMSLGAIDFGLIVDGSVVMIENSVRHLSERREELKRDLTRGEVYQTVLRSAHEVARPVLFAVMIIIIVYLPIMTLEDTEGKMFRPMAYTVALALIGSLILSLTLIPALASLLLRGDTREKENFILAPLRRGYARVLDWTMAHRTATVGGAGLFFCLTAALFPLLGSEFIPRLDEGSLAISISRLPSVSLPESVQQGIAAERIIKSFPEVDAVVSKVGRAEIATDPMGVDISDLVITLRPRSEWRTVRTKEELVEKMSKALEKMPGMGFGFSQPIELRVNELISGVKSDVAIKLFGEDLDVLTAKADEIVDAVAKIPGARDTKAELITGLPQLQIKVDRDAIARHGINVADVQEIIETAIGGKSATQVIEGDKRFDLVVRFPERARNDVEAISNILVSAPTGERVPLSQLSTISMDLGPAQISREHGARRISIEANVRGRDIGSFVAEAQRAVAAKVKLDPGYYAEWGGTFENLQRARTRLMIVVPVSLFLIFVLLFTMFNSLRLSVLIFTGVPLAVTGGILALYFRGMPFSISAGVGFIALFGVAVLNGVVMVSYINDLRAQGKSVHDAVQEGALVRLRPVLMTALVASLGFVPMALATGTGSEVQKPLATVVIGGLITSTLLTLIVLPTLYSWFEREPDKGEI